MAWDSCWGLLPALIPTPGPLGPQEAMGSDSYPYSPVLPVTWARMSWVGLADLIWTPQNCKRLAIGLPLWVLPGTVLGTVLLSHSLWFNHSSLLFSPRSTWQVYSCLGLCGYCCFCLEHLSPALSTLVLPYLSSLGSNVTSSEGPSLTFLCKVTHFFTFCHITIIYIFDTFIMPWNDRAYLQMRKCV